MRDRVMDVQQVELFGSRDRRHLCGEREVIRLMFEERIRHHLDLVKMNTLVQLGKPRRHDGRDEMDIVPAFGKITPEFRTDNAAAAVGRIDCYTDIHSCRLKFNRNRFSYKVLDAIVTANSDKTIARQARSWSCFTGNSPVISGSDVEFGTAAACKPFALIK